MIYEKVLCINMYAVGKVITFNWCKCFANSVSYRLLYRDNISHNYHYHIFLFAKLPCGTADILFNCCTHNCCQFICIFIAMFWITAVLLGNDYLVQGNCFVFLVRTMYCKFLCIELSAKNY